MYPNIHDEPLVKRLLEQKESVAMLAKAHLKGASPEEAFDYWLKHLDAALNKLEAKA